MRGGDKTLEPVGGVPLLRQLVDRAALLGFPVYVALPHDRPDRLRALDGTGAIPVSVPDAEMGMSASLAAGARAAAPSDLLILLADMPEIEAEDLAAMVDAFRKAGGDRPVRAFSADGRAGHPVLLPARLASRLSTLEGDRGARTLLSDERIVSVGLAGNRAVTDLDTPEDWSAWRRGRNGS